MENELTELCPICIEKPADYYTECNHGYCIGCLCRIKKCAMCRKPLLREKLCKAIREKFENKRNLTFEREMWGNIIPTTNQISQMEYIFPQTRHSNHGLNDRHHNRYREITLPEITNLRRNYNISEPLNIIRIPTRQRVRH
jgi:hypothetical protein